MKAHVLFLPALLLAAGCATTRSAAPEHTPDETDETVEQQAEPGPDPSIPVAVEAEPLAETSPLQTIVLPNAATPLVTFRLVFRTGSVDDPAGKEGLTALTSAVMSEGGTRSLSSAELIEALFPMAAELSMSVDKELTVYEGRVHRDHLDAFIPVFVEVLTTPRFAENEFNRLRDRALTHLRNGLRNEDDEALGQAALQSILYAGHPAAHPIVGTEAGLESITLEDVQAHAKAVFTQDRLIVGLAGAVDDALATRLTEKLNGLAATGAARAALPPTPAVAGQTLILQRPTLSTAVSMGFTYPVRRGHPDFYALAFAMSYLGEHRQSIGVLFNELRERRGLNYGDYAYVEAFVQDGWSTLPSSNVLRTQQFTSLWLRPVEPEHAVFATRGALHFYEKLLAAPISQEAFDTARGFIQGVSRLWEQTDSQRLGWAIDGLLYGTPDHLDRYREALNALTPEQVHAAVNRHLSPVRMNFAYVTQDAEGLARALASQEPSPIAYATPKDASVIQEDAQFIAAPLPLQGAPEVQAAADFMKEISTP